MGTKSVKRTLWRGFVMMLVASFLASGALRLWGEGRAFATDGLVSPELAVTGDQMPLEQMNALIESLNERERLLDARSRELDLAQADLEIAKQEIKMQLEELVEAEERLASRMAVSNEASANDLAQLTRVYEAMKPKGAADLFAEMAPEFAAEFLVRMAPESAAAVFSNLPPDAAYALSAVMAGRNALAATEPQQ